MTQLPTPIAEWFAHLSQHVKLPAGTEDGLRAALQGPTAERSVTGGVSEQRIDRYTVLETLGEGGTGTVYKVFDPQLQRVVALKLIHQHRIVNENALARFITESRTTARIQHPSVLPVHELGRLADGRVFFTMQQVEGRTLTEALQALHRGVQGAPSRRDLIGVLQRVAEAVTYAHAQDIVHRDLKPDNVMLGEFGEVYVLDWGIARLLTTESPEPSPDPAELAPTSRRMTGFGQAIGSPDYMAPEQAAGAAVAVGHTADIYALGGMLFEILVGRPPVLGLADVQQNLSSEGGPIPLGLEDLLRRTLTPDPRVRYTDTRGVLKGLHQWLKAQTSWAESTGLLRDARELLEDARALESAALSRRAAAEAEARGVPAWASESAYLDAWALEDEASALEQRAASLREERVHMLRLALAAAPDNSSVQDALADHYLEQHIAAEASGDETARAEVMLRRFDRGRFRSYLAGTGALTLHVAAAGAVGRLRRWETLHRRRVLVQGGEELALPVTAHPLPLGSYTVMLTAPGCISARYPIKITREARWDATAPGERSPTPIQLPQDGSIATNERVVLAGWMSAGGDCEAAGASPSPRRYWVPSFSMSRFPVTNAEYLHYLTALWSMDADAARAALPAAAGGDPLGLGERGPDLREGAAQLPVVGVTLAQARGYAQWRASRDGLGWRLPNEWEWEKAGRGVDGRRYPWGDHFTPPRCNMRLSHRGAPALAPVGTFSIDRSPYEIGDMAGGVEEWCDSRFGEPPPSGSRVTPTASNDETSEHTLRGGAWRSPRQGCLLARRGPAMPDWSSQHVGFRLVRSLP